MKKRIVLSVEGEGELQAARKLLSRLLTEQSAWDAVILDETPLRVGQFHKLAKDDYREWKRKLATALKRRQVGGVLLLLDGDVSKFGALASCAADAARSLAEKARDSGGGTTFSVAVVFARQEFESWLIAGFPSLAGKRLPSGRRIADDANLPAGNLEESPRDAKGWLNQQIEGGYKPTRDQAEMTAMVDLTEIRARGMRSFQRLEAAVSELVAAIRSGQHVVTPF